MGKSALTVQIRTCVCNISTELQNYQTPRPHIYAKSSSGPGPGRGTPDDQLRLEKQLGRRDRAALDLVDRVMTQPYGDCCKKLQELPAEVSHFRRYHAVGWPALRPPAHTVGPSRRLTAGHGSMAATAGAIGSLSSAG